MIRIPHKSRNHMLEAPENISAKSIESKPIRNKG
jgi:hypothetical protein